MMMALSTGGTAPSGDGMLLRLPAPPVAPRSGPADDLGEVVRFERRPADEGPVDLGLGHEGGDVARLDAAAVLDADGRRRALAGEAGHHRPDGPDRLVGVLGGGVAPGADGPDRLVGDDEAGDLLGRQA